MKIDVTEVPEVADGIEYFVLPPSDGADSDPGAAPEIIDPLTGECIAADDLDALIDLHERCRREADKIYVAKTLCAKALAAATSGDAKTRRLVTASGRKVKVEMPDNRWNQKTCKDLWVRFPDFAATYLRIASIDPQMREVKKLRETECKDVALATFKQQLLAAEEKATATPKISIES